MDPVVTVIETATTVAAALGRAAAKVDRDVVNPVPDVAKAAPADPKVPRTAPNGRSDHLALRVTPTRPSSRARNEHLAARVPNAALAPNDPEPSDRLVARTLVVANVLRVR